jgi:hypothetical protein
MKVATGNSWIFYNNGTSSRRTSHQQINLTINIGETVMPYYYLAQSSDPAWKPFILAPFQWIVDPTALRLGNLVFNPWLAAGTSGVGGIGVTSVQWRVGSFDSVGFKNGIIPVGTLSYTGAAAGPSAGGAVTVGTKTAKNFFDKSYGLSVGFSARGNYSYTGTEGAITETSEENMQITDTNINLVWSTLFSTMDILPGKGMSECTHHDFSLKAKQSQTIFLTVKSDKPVFTYLLSDSDFDNADFG